MPKYILGPIKQLIDINGPLVSFKSTFFVKNSDKKPFEGVVVSQTQIDNDPSIEYKQSNDNGEFRGEITYDKSEYQSFYLLLKAVEAVEVEVTINTVEIPSKQPHLPGAAALVPSTSTWKSYIPTIAWVIVGLTVVYYIWSNWTSWFGASKSNALTETLLPVVPDAKTAVKSSSPDSARSSPISLGYKKSSRRRKSTPYNSPVPSTVSSLSNKSSKDLFGKLDKL
jgi:hypothetical protein